MNAVREFLFVVLLVAGCGSAHGDPAPTIVVNGAQYLASSPAGLKIDASDVTPFAAATDVVDTASVVGNAVYALNGVGPAKVVVMRSTAADVPYTLFIRVGIVPTSAASGNTTFLDAVPGICNYFAPTAGGC